MTINLGILRAQEVLQLSKKHFEADFDFSDVRNILHINKILLPREILMIDKCDKGIEQIDCLFFILGQNLEKLLNFINIIGHMYPWLSMQISKGLDDTINMETLLAYQEKIIELHFDEPRFSDFNVHRTEYKYQIYKYLMSLERNECVVVTGLLGHGKQWLAIDACCNFWIIDRMEQNIFLLDLAKCKTPESILEKQLRLLHMLKFRGSGGGVGGGGGSGTSGTNGGGGAVNVVSGTSGSSGDESPEDHKCERFFDETIAIKIDTLREKLIYMLKNRKNCLLVLLNVQDQKTLDAFKLRCKMLITTRNKETLSRLSKSSMKIVEISKGFRSNESLELFSKVLNVPINELCEEAREIHRKCRGNPFLIWLVASNINDFPKVDKWKEWIYTLEEYEPTKHHTINEIISQSLSGLSQEMKKLFDSLSIFGDNIKIHLSVLQRYWQRNEYEVEQIVDKFDKLYLLEKIKNGTIFCSLQYYYCAYLINTINDDEKLEMHRRLVNSYKICEAIEQRTEPNIVMFPDDRYFYFYIAYHLQKSGMYELFPKLFLDFGFLEQKLRATGLPNTIGDLELYRSDIIQKDKEREQLLDELLGFLRNVEEMLKKSPNTSLLQYAITTDGILKREAIRQAAQFNNRLFFMDADHIYRHREIVPLPKTPIVTRFCNPSVSLIGYIDHSIMLTDISPSYTIESTLYDGEHKSNIVDIQIFRQKYFLSLDEDGICNLWSLEHTPINRRRSTSSSLTDLSVVGGGGGGTGSGNGTAGMVGNNCNVSNGIGGTGVGSNMTNGGGLNNNNGSSKKHGGGVRQGRAESFDKKFIHKGKCIQKLKASETNNNNNNNGNVNNNLPDRINCIHLFERTTNHHYNSDGSGLQLFLPTNKGFITIYDWNSMTERFEYHFKFKTDHNKINKIIHIVENVLMLLTSSGYIHFIDLKDTSTMQMTTKWTKNFFSPINLHRLDPIRVPDNNDYDDDDYDNIDAVGSVPHRQQQQQQHQQPLIEYRVIVVFKRHVIQVNFNIKNKKIDNFHTKELYETKKTENHIVCSCMSKDMKYLFFGTEKGVTVFDIKLNMEVLRSNVSDSLVCIDVCSVADQYLLMCGTKNGGQIMYIYALTVDEHGRMVHWTLDCVGVNSTPSAITSPTTVTNNGTPTTSSSSSLNRPNNQLIMNTTRLIGKRLYKVNNINAETDLFSLIVVDSNDVIHQKSSTDRFIKSENRFTNESMNDINGDCGGGRVTAIDVATGGGYNDLTVVGYQNGKVFIEKMEISNELFGKPIIYLKCFTVDGFNVIVAGTNDSYIIINNQHKELIRSSPIADTFLLTGQLILVVVKQSGRFKLFDLKTNQLTRVSVPGQFTYGGCDFMDKCLAIASKNEINTWEIIFSNDIIDVQTLDHRPQLPPTLTDISCIKLSTNCEFCAIGTERGAIYLFKFPEFHFIHEFKSVMAPINSMIFSPWSSASASSISLTTNSPQQPIILATVSAEICFWNVSYVVNGFKSVDKSRRSLRFTNPPKQQQYQQQIVNGGTTAPPTPTLTTQPTMSNSSSNSSGIYSSEEISMNSISDVLNRELLDENNQHQLNPWYDLIGPSKKRELLSCIKFVGSAAHQLFTNKKFTRFLTIDDEGEIYFLNIFNATNEWIKRQDHQLLLEQQQKKLQQQHNQIPNQLKKHVNTNLINEIDNFDNSNDDEIEQNGNLMTKM